MRISSTLRVLPRGATLDQDGVDVARARTILETLEQSVDLVVVSTGPLHLSAGALAWGQAADSTIIVAARDQSRRDDVEYAAESLRLVGVDKVGTVLVERKRAIRRGKQGTPPEPARPVFQETPREPFREPFRPEPVRETYGGPFRETYREPLRDVIRDQGRRSEADDDIGLDDDEPEPTPPTTRSPRRRNQPDRPSV